MSLVKVYLGTQLSRPLWGLILGTREDSAWGFICHEDVRAGKKKQHAAAVTYSYWFSQYVLEPMRGDKQRQLMETFCTVVLFKAQPCAEAEPSPECKTCSQVWSQWSTLQEPGTAMIASINELSKELIRECCSPGLNTWFVKLNRSSIKLGSN